MNIDEIDKRYFLMVHDSGTFGDIQQNDIAVSCPICHEGKSWKKKHRLHLYTKTGYEHPAVACFNCGYSSNLYGYLKEFYPSEFIIYKNEKSGKSFNELKIINYEQKEQTEQTEQIKTIENIKKPKTLIEPIEFQQIPEEVIEYIKKRGIEPQADWLYSPFNNKVEFEHKNIILSEFIIIPLSYNNKWFGFQALAWKQKKFFVYLCKENTSWKVWNFFNVNLEEPVYIFESVYDAISSGKKNSIAQLGANLHENRLNELKHPVFCLDNQLCDTKSKEETLKYLNKGYSAFIWPKGSEKFKDTNDLRKLGVPFEKISKMISDNIYDGIHGILKLKMM